MKESKGGETAILIASKRNKLEAVKFLTANGCDINALDLNQLNSLDNAIILGLYDIAFYLYDKIKPKTLDEYLEIGNKLKSPYYNMPLFMEHLEIRTDPSAVPCFKLSGKKAKGLNH